MITTGGVIVNSPEYVYCCCFEYAAAIFQVESTRGISVFKDGFWLNPEWQLTNGMDACTWIPPHRILYIKKKRIQ